jgi:hypothetical protein
MYDLKRGKRFPDFSGKRSLLVEAAGQLILLFREGLDYAFILHRQRGESDAGRVIRIVPSRSGSWGQLGRLLGSAGP